MEDKLNQTIQGLRNFGMNLEVQAEGLDVACDNVTGLVDLGLVEEDKVYKALLLLRALQQLTWETADELCTVYQELEEKKRLAKLLQ